MFEGEISRIDTHLRKNITTKKLAMVNKGEISIRDTNLRKIINKKSFKITVPDWGL